MEDDDQTVDDFLAATVGPCRPYGPRLRYAQRDVFLTSSKPEFDLKLGCVALAAIHGRSCIVRVSQPMDMPLLVFESPLPKWAASGAKRTSRVLGKEMSEGTILQVHAESFVNTNPVDDTLFQAEDDPADDRATRVYLLPCQFTTYIMKNDPTVQVKRRTHGVVRYENDGRPCLIFLRTGLPSSFDIKEMPLHQAFVEERNRANLLMESPKLRATSPHPYDVKEWSAFLRVDVFYFDA